MTAAQEIDAIIAKAVPWKAQKLKELRSIITKASSDITETVKWKMPSKLEGVAVWESNGIVCHADILKNAVRLTFHKGPFLKDPKEVFNTRLDSKVVRAVDFLEYDQIDEVSLRDLILEGVTLNLNKKLRK